MTEQQILESYGLPTDASDRALLLALMAKLLIEERTNRIVPQKGGGA